MGNQPGGEADLSKLTPLALAAFNGDEEELKKLLSGAKAKAINKRDKVGRSALSWAAYNGHAKCVQLLYEAGAEVDPVDSGDGTTPLHNAVRAEHYEAVKVLLSAGADVSYQDSEARSALHFAAHSGNVSMGALLISYKCPLDLIDLEGRTPLHWATFNGHERFVKLLLKEGAAVDKQDKAGRSSLTYAAHLGHADLVERLLAYKADTQLTDFQSMRPIEHARFNKHPACVELIAAKVQEESDAAMGATMVLDDEGIEEELNAEDNLELQVWTELRSAWYINELMDVPCWCETDGEGQHAELVAQVNALREQVRRLEQENSDLERGLREALDSQDAAKIESKQTKLRNDLTELRSMYKRAQRSIAAADVTIDRLKSENSRAVNAYTNLEIKYAKLQDECEALRKAAAGGS